MLRFIPLGGGGEIGANSYYLNIAGTGIILDCGMHPQKSGPEALPLFSLIKEEPVDYVLISHAHQDHLSALPFLVQNFPYVKIITTPQTRALAELTLHDSVSILKEQMTEDQRLRVYSHEEIDLLIRSIEYRAYNEIFFLQGYKHISQSGISAEFYDAGHILGSAGILLKHAGETVFYTGDISPAKQEIMPPAALPGEKVDILIMETTYGSTDSTGLLTWNKEAERFAKEANKIFSGGGSILIPVFSLGKTQELLAAIWRLIEKGKLIKIPICTGGIGKKISRVYDYNRYAVNFNNRELELHSIPQKNLFEIDNAEDFFREPCIVLASSGMMLEQTASFRLAKSWIKHENAAIFIVGYMEESTPGYRFANAFKGGKMRVYPSAKEEDVRCAVKRFRFPSHSRREELLGIVKKVKAKTVILVHGEPASVDWVGENILRENKNIKLYTAEIGKEIILNSK